MEKEIAEKQIGKRRYWELDFLRGFCVILMVIDHLLFSLYDVLPDVCSWCGRDFWVGAQEFAEKYWFNYARNAAQIFVSSLFFFICGISCTLSHNNLKRGLMAAGVAVFITVGTYAVRSATGLVIWFGVIHMLAAAILIFYLLSLVGKLIVRAAGKNPSAKKAAVLEWTGKLFPAAVGLILLIVYFGAFGHIGLARTFVGEKEVKFPQILYDVSKKSSTGKNRLLSLFVGVKNFSLDSADYFPLLPHAAIVLVGSGVGHLLYGRGKNYLAPLDGVWNKPVAYVGRKALFVYVFHQILIVAFLYGIGAIYLIQK